ncbi:hypothetical protein [Flavobacterium album]|nr:hypothetical protein [Flavobacterium album]
MYTLRASKISLSFGAKKILDNASFKCRFGEIVGIFGRNGS